MRLKPQHYAVLLLLVGLFRGVSAFSQEMHGVENSTPSASLQKLSLKDAMELAAEHNVKSRIAGEKVHESAAKAREASAGLYPKVSAYVSQSSETLNLAALGFEGELFPGLSRLLGPFGVFDARIGLVQNIFNWESIKNHQAGQREAAKSKVEAALAREQASFYGGLAYLDLLQSQAKERGAESDVQLAQSFVKILRDQFNAGIANSLDQTRVETQLASAQSLLTLIQAKRQQAELQLKRVIGASLGQSLQLSDALKLNSEKIEELNRAIQEGEDRRLELKVAQEELNLRQLKQKAAVGRLMPTMSVNANYGALGNYPNKNLEDTYQVGVKMDIPVFDGGLSLGKVSEAKSQTKQAEILLEDLQTQIEQDVRLAYQNLQKAEALVQNTQQTWTLAQRQMKQIQNQYQAGVGDSLALVNAQNALAKSREEYFSALAQYQAARMSLVYAQGKIEEFSL